MPNTETAQDILVELGPLVEAVGRNLAATKRTPEDLLLLADTLDDAAKALRKLANIRGFELTSVL